MVMRPEPVNEFFKDPPLLWQVVQNRSGHRYLGQAHCPACKAVINNQGHCMDPACGKSYKLINGDYNATREIASIRYDAAQKQGHLIVVARGAKEAEDKAETDKYFVNTTLENKEGRLQGVITMGEKTTDQKAKDKVQLFIDFRSKEIRHDHTNAPPETVASRIQAVFNDEQSHTSVYEQEDSASSFSQTPKIELLKEGSEGWANWGGPGMGAGFRYHLEIDNFEGKTDFIKDIRIKSKSGSGQPWSTTNYKFDELDANAKLMIEAGVMTDRWVFLTDRPGQNQSALPDIDQDIVELAVTLRSTGRTIDIKIPSSRLKNH